MPVVTLTLSWKGEVEVKSQHQFNPFYVNKPQKTKVSNGWYIEICETKCTNPTDFSSCKFRRMDVCGENGPIKWVLAPFENVNLQTGNQFPNWNSPPTELVTQHLGILEDKGYKIVSSNSMFCGQETGPIWTWTLH